MIKNKSILFITDSCPPNLTMSGIVMKNIMDTVCENNKIYIIAIRQSDRDVREYKGAKIKYVKTFSYHILKLREKKINAKNRFTSLLYEIAAFCYRIVSISTRIISPIGVNFLGGKEIRKKLEATLKKENVDIVLCNAKPFESFEAILPLVSKYKNIKFVAYQTDDFVKSEDERYMPDFLLKRRSEKRKKRINDYANKFHNYCILESVYKKEIGYIDDKKKVKIVGIPLLFDHDVEFSARGIQTVTGCGNKKERICMVFTGSLVKSYRPPDDCMDIILELAKEIKIYFDIYHRGDCGDVINQYVKKSNGIIRNYGAVDTETAYKAIEKADILISISNYSGDQISGKIFDYMSTGKPIIHFYYYENDMNAAVLEKYDLAKNIMIQKEAKNTKAQEIIKFIKEVNGKRMNFNEIKENYKQYMPQSVIKALFNESFD